MAALRIASPAPHPTKLHTRPCVDAMASDARTAADGRKEEDDAVARVAHHHGWHDYLRSLDSDEAREVAQLKRRYADTFVDLTCVGGGVPVV